MFFIRFHWKLIFNKNPVYNIIRFHVVGEHQEELGGGGEFHFKGFLHMCLIHKAVGSHV